VTPDPFVHLPHLRGRLTPALESGMRFTQQTVAEMDERLRHEGRGAEWRLTDQAREASRQSLLGHLLGKHDIWFFGYGSLMWDPAVHFAEVRLARLQGYARRFTNRLPMARGTPEHPALMLSLDRCAGVCSGLAFRIPADQAEVETEFLWRREMLRGSYIPLLLPLPTPQGEIEAIVLTANTQHPDYLHEMPLEQTAQMIARATGPRGSNLSYLDNVACQLALLGLQDDYIGHLLARVQAINRA
jgi:cation transport protein ChaC